MQVSAGRATMLTRKRRKRNTSGLAPESASTSRMAFARRLLRSSSCIHVSNTCTKLYNSLQADAAARPGSLPHSCSPTPHLHQPEVPR